MCRTAGIRSPIAGRATARRPARLGGSRAPRSIARRADRRRLRGPRDLGVRSRSYFGRLSSARVFRHDRRGRAVFFSDGGTLMAVIADLEQVPADGLTDLGPGDRRLRAPISFLVARVRVAALVQRRVARAAEVGASSPIGLRGGLATIARGFGGRRTGALHGCRVRSRLRGLAHYFRFGDVGASRSVAARRQKRPDSNGLENNCRPSRGRQRFFLPTISAIGPERLIRYRAPRRPHRSAGVVWPALSPPLATRLVGAHLQRRGRVGRRSDCSMLIDRRRMCGR